MPVDNATNTARQVDSEARVLTAVETIRSRGEPLGVRAIARLAGASMSTVRKLRQHWQPEADEITTGEEATADDAQWSARLAVFHPHPLDEYLQSVWPEPVTPHIIARWYVQMRYLRQLYRMSAIHLAPATYRMFADWMNTILEYAEHQYHPRVLQHCVNHWEGDPAETMLADGALAGIKLPEGVTGRLANICNHQHQHTITNDDAKPGKEERSHGTNV